MTTERWEPDARRCSGIVTSMSGFRSALRGLPFPVRLAVAGAALLGSLGGIAGLVVGLRVHASTAWAATFEVGVPAAVLGAMLGLAFGSVAAVSRRWHHPFRR